MRALSLLIISIFTLSTISISNAAIIDKVLEPAKKLIERGKKELKVIDVSQKLSLDMDIIDGLNAQVRYSYEVEPAYIKTLYTRVDKYRFKLGVEAGDFFSDHSPIFLNIDSTAEVVFARLFEKQKTAFLSPPLYPHQLPITARKFDELPEETLVSIPTKLNLNVGIKTLNVGPQLSGFAEAYYLLSGQFTVQVIKSAKKARIRIFTNSSTKRGVRGGVKLDLDIFEVGILNDAVDLIVNRKLLSLNANNENGQVVLFDYLLDMKNKSVREAYNRLLSSTYQFQKAKVLASFLKDKNIKETIVSDLSFLQKMAEEDRNKKKKRVEKRTEGVDNYSQRTLSGKLKLTVYNWESSRSTQRHHYQYKDSSDKTKNLVMLGRSERNEKEGFRFFKLTNYNNYYVIGKADGNGNPIKDSITDIGMDHEHKDQSFSYLEQEKKRKDLFKLITPELANRLVNWSQIITKKRQSGARVYYSISMNKNAKNIIKNLSQSNYNKLVQLLFSYRDHLFKEKGYVFGGGNNRDIIRFADFLSRAFTETNSNQERSEQLDKFIKFTKTDTFEDIGFGAIIYVLKNSQTKIPLEKLIKVDFYWSSQEVGLKKRSFGFEQYSEEKESLEFIREVIIRGRSLDFRLVGYAR